MPDADVVDLIDDHAATVTLLRNPLAWRTRVVEEVSIDAASACQRRRSLQAAPLREVLRPHLADAAGAKEALVALYVAPMPRGPLLDFDIQGPLGDAWLLPRREIAERQAQYLSAVAADCEVAIDEDVWALLTAILGFTGSQWFIDRKVIPFSDYMEDGLGRQITPEVLNEWREIGTACRAILRPHLDMFKGYSAPENPALALPELVIGDGSQPVSDEQGTQMLRGYLGVLRAMVSIRGGVGEAAREFLIALADYGNSYDMMAAMRVPLDEPFLVKCSERRAVSLSAVRNRGAQELVIADAQSNHVTFKVSDPNVRVSSFIATQPDAKGFAFGLFPSKSDEQTRSFYAHNADRDYRVNIEFELRLLRRLQLVPYFAAGLLALLAGALLVERTTDLRTLAVVAGPSALAASILLAREPSTLGSRLRLASSATLFAALAVLVGAGTGLFLYGWLCR